jgi:hypothetical protein
VGDFRYVSHDFFSSINLASCDNSAAYPSNLAPRNVLWVARRECGSRGR